MNQPNRKTGIGIIGEVLWGTHFCQFYRTPQDLLDILVPYFMEGLRNNEYCMWVTSEPLKAKAARAALAAAMPDYDDYARQGQIEIIPHTEWYLRGGSFNSERVLSGWVEKLDAALAAGYEGLRLTGNTFWLEKEHWAAFTDYEAEVDSVIGRYRMLAVCTYSLDRCGANEILDVIANHRFALIRREERWELIESADSRRTKEELKRLAQFPEQNPNPVLRLTIGGDLIYANPPASALLEAMGKTEAGPIPPAIRALAGKAAKSSESVEAELSDNSGRTHWFAAIRPQSETYVNLYVRDVTSRKEAESSLQRSREWLRVTLNSIGDAVLATDADCRIAFLNPVAVLLTGWTVDEALGRPIEEVFRIVNELTREPIEDLCTRVLAEGRAIVLANNSCLIARDGREVPIEDSAAPILDDAGLVTGAVLVFHDVTVKRQTQQALRESEQRFRSLFSSMTEGFAVHEIITDDRGRPVDYRFLDLNPAFERLTGLKSGAVVGRRVTEVLPGIEPFWIETYGRVALTGEPVTFEHYYPAPLNRWYQVYSYRPAPGQFATIFMDVTDRKRTEEALRRRQSEIKALFDNTPAGLVLFDAAPPYTVLVHNKYYQELFAEPFRTKGMAGLNVYEYAPEVEAAGVVAVFDEVVRTKQPKSYLDFPYNSNPPKESWFNWHMSPIIMDGRVIALVSMSVDVTDRHLAERALRESEERLKRAQEVAHLGSWEFDLLNNRLTWSDEVYRLFGLTPKEFGATYEAFLDAVHPDDRASTDAAFSGSMREERDSFEIEYRIVRRNTAEVRVVSSRFKHQRDSTGRIVRSIGTVHDVTERKRTEALRLALAEQERLRLGAAVEQASDSVVMVDLDGTIQYVNAAFESINRITRDKAIGHSYFDRLAGKSPSLPAVREAIAHGRPWHGQLSGSIAGGRPIELAVTISPATDPSGKVTGGLITEKDVTQENALQRQVRQSQKMEALGTLAGGITHDFNNILSTIFINTELALLDLDPVNPARRSLPIVLQAANRGRELVKQIITFSRQREWERKPLEAGPIVKEVMKFLRSTLPKDIAIHESIAPDCGPIQADPSQVHQILVNLCQNAALAMAACAGHLEVKLEPVQVDTTLAARHPDLKPGPYVRLTVADTGCGMTSDLMERIFEPFFTTRKHGEGSGLGLAVVHGIIKSYDGAITVYSEPGKGSVFNVYIPRLAGEASAGEKGKRVRLEKGEEHILLVEDEEAQLKGMTRLLERLGYRVTPKPSGRAALAAFKKKPDGFDLVITDQAMPRLTGVELARALIKVRPDIPIILCTGFSEKVNGETVGHDGIRSFVMKPFSIEEISKHIRVALKKGGPQ